MIGLRCAVTLSLWAGLSNGAAAAEDEKGDPFVYDAADAMVRAAVLGNANYYDADVLRVGDDLWLTWLEFFPGKGDHLWLGHYVDGKFALKRRVSPKTGNYANPTITAAGQGQLWLSYEMEVDGQWDVALAKLSLDPGSFFFPPTVRAAAGPGPDINHRTAATPDGGLWLVWQSDAGGQFDILARRIIPNEPSRLIAVSDSPQVNDWHPDVAVSSDGAVHVVWDAYDGGSYNVYARSWRDGEWGEVVAVARTPAFEGRAKVAAGGDGRVWLAWEEGCENWGRPYRARMHLKWRGYRDIADARGPLHRFRRIRLALLEPDGAVRPLGRQLPLPAIDLAASRPSAPAGVELLGAFYERAVLTVDDLGRLWVAYRHYYAPWMGIETRSHVETGWGLYARCLAADGWSKLQRFAVGQGDGMQRLEITPLGGGITAAWTTGRTDRRKNDRPRGVVLATLAAGGNPPASAEAEPAAPKPAMKPATRPAHPRTRPRPTAVAGKEYHLFFGDLHRHTDLSLCRVPFDGTMDDAYRYAIDVAQLDFLGITDHSRDLALGNALSQLWWRCRKEVTRHELKPDFFPMFAYERSRPGADHNVISLRPDMLRPHTYPHPELWKELDDDTITIPHQTITDPLEDPSAPPRSLRPEVWSTHDEARRPLLEIYQGCRDRSIERDAHEGLARRYLFGFIASSDHLSTAASYAGVWAEERSRESIFRALQARRTFGATDKLRLIVRAGHHWMGEYFTAPGIPPIDIEAEGTAGIELIEVIIDGRVCKVLGQTQRQLEVKYTPEAFGAGFHYLYVRLRQTDGNQAWSSPIWVNVQPHEPAPSRTEASNRTPGMNPGPGATKSSGSG